MNWYYPFNDTTLKLDMSISTLFMVDRIDFVTQLTGSPRLNQNWDSIFIYQTFSLTDIGERFDVENCYTNMQKFEKLSSRYKKHTLTADDNINIVEQELVNNKKELV